MIAILVAVLVVLLAAGLVAYDRFSRGIERLKRTRLVVHTTDEHSIRGTLVETYRDSIVIAEAEYLREAQPENLPGRAVIPRSRVAWIQALEE